MQVIEAPTPSNQRESLDVGCWTNLILIIYAVTAQQEDVQWMLELYC